jgi:hypothetical protein
VKSIVETRETENYETKGEREVEGRNNKLEMENSTRKVNI